MGMHREWKLVKKTLSSIYKKSTQTSEWPEKEIFTDGLGKKLDGFEKARKAGKGADAKRFADQVTTVTGRYRRKIKARDWPSTKIRPALLGALDHIDNEVGQHLL